jgi:membrane-associated phospholipid phosphatase
MLRGTMSAPPIPATGWFAQLRQRITILWPIKSVGTMFWIAAFFSGYFWVLRNPSAEVIIMPLTPVDRLIGFQPGALALYVSLWVYVSLGPALVKSFRELFSFGLATLVMSLIGLGIFFYWPTAVPVFEFDVSQSQVLSVLKGVDLAGNACPSLHVSFAVFSGIWLHRILRETRSPHALLWLNWLWCVGIVYSTVATRQHVALDVFAGAVLGVAVAAAHIAGLRRFEQRGTRAPGRAAIGRVPGA